MRNEDAERKERGQLVSVTHLGVQLDEKCPLGIHAKFLGTDRP